MRYSPLTQVNRDNATGKHGQAKQTEVANPLSHAGKFISDRFSPNKASMMVWDRATGNTESAGINRHVAGDARALGERRQRLHPDL